MKRFGLYIHIPFCKAKCPYCDFYSVKYTEEQAEAYTEAVLKAMEQAPEQEAVLDTIYFGGGTPVLMGAKRLLAMVNKAKACFAVSEDCEITVMGFDVRLILRSIENDIIKYEFSMLKI